MALITIKNLTMEESVEKSKDIQAFLRGKEIGKATNFLLTILYQNKVHEYKTAFWGDFLGETDYRQVALMIELLTLYYQHDPSWLNLIDTEKQTKEGFQVFHSATILGTILGLINSCSLIKPIKPKSKNLILTSSLPKALISYLEIGSLTRFEKIIPPKNFINDLGNSIKDNFCDIENKDIQIIETTIKKIFSLAKNSFPTDSLLTPLQREFIDQFTSKLFHYRNTMNRLILMNNHYKNLSWDI
jgi:hypothetical protein